MNLRYEPKEKLQTFDEWGREQKQKTMDKATLVTLSNLVNTLLAALDALDAPQDVKDALTQSGDCDHVHWWITEGRKQTQPNKDDMSSGPKS